MRKTPGPRMSRCWTLAGSTGVAALALALAGGAAAGAATGPANPPSAVSGSVAALATSSMEVQNPTTGQTTVTWTSGTQFSQTVTERVSAVTAGDCVSVTGTASKKSKTTIAARSISVVAASSTGSCTGTTVSRGGGPGGAFPGRGAFAGGGAVRFGQGGGPPGGGKGQTFTGGGFGARFPGSSNLAIASGKITAVKGSTLSLTGFSFTPALRSNATRSSKNKRPETPKTEKLQITTSGSTTVDATQAAAATSLAVGDCVSAFGPAASNGAITATTVRITATGASSCTMGAGRLGGPVGPFGGQVSGGSNA